MCDNILVGVVYLCEMYDCYGNVSVMLVVYNVGLGCYDDFVLCGCLLFVEIVGYFVWFVLIIGVVGVVDVVVIVMFDLIVWCCVVLFVCIISVVLGVVVG